MQRQRVYFTRDEVVVHNSHDDIWTIVNDRVFDLTKLFVREEPMDDIRRLLLVYAGKDLSHFFNEENFPLYRVNQYGDSVAVFPPVTIDDWWRDESKIIGHITSLERRIRFINTLTHKTTMMSVCEEDSLDVIKLKLRIILKYSTDNLVWRKKCSSASTPLSGRLVMDKTLTQNGMPFHENEKLFLPPAIWLFPKL